MMMDSAFSTNLQGNKLKLLNVIFAICMLYVYTTRRYFLKVMLSRELVLSSFPTKCLSSDVMGNKRMLRKLPNYLSNRPLVSMGYRLINHAGCW